MVKTFEDVEWEKNKLVFVNWYFFYWNALYSICCKSLQNPIGDRQFLNTSIQTEKFNIYDVFGLCLVIIGFMTFRLSLLYKDGGFGFCQKKQEGNDEAMLLSPDSEDSILPSSSSSVPQTHAPHIELSSSSISCTHKRHWTLWFILFRQLVFTQVIIARRIMNPTFPKSAY